MKLKNFYRPTPAKWRKLGDTLLGISTTITGYSLYNNLQWVAGIALVLGVLGKFLTDFFVEDPKI
jgi:hypothetical protein